jgi:hypothetical protein
MVNITQKQQRYLSKPVYYQVGSNAHGEIRKKNVVQLPGTKNALSSSATTITGWQKGRQKRNSNGWVDCAGHYFIRSCVSGDPNEPLVRHGQHGTCFRNERMKKPASTGFAELKKF